MPLVKRPVTPVRLAANRRAARNSTGPRTAEGKSRSSLNSLRGGLHSKTIAQLVRVLSEAPPGGVLRMARLLMTPAQLSAPAVASALDLFRKRDVRIRPVSANRFPYKKGKTQRE